MAKKRSTWVWSPNSSYASEEEYRAARYEQQKKYLAAKREKDEEAFLEWQRQNCRKNRAKNPTSEVAMEKQRIRARAYYNKHKDDPEFQEKRRKEALLRAASPEGKAVKEAYLAKPETKLLRKQTKNRWDEENKDHVREYARVKGMERYYNDPQHRIACGLRTRFLHAVKKNQSKKASAVRDLGMEIAEFKDYLQDRFLDGMTWENQGEWCMDHVKPLAAFDLEDEMQQKAACHYTNIQPLWWADNNAKRDRFTPDDERRYYHERAYPDNY